MVTQTKVAICMPAREEVAAGFAFSLLKLSLYSQAQGIEILPQIVTSSGIVGNRNRLAEWALKTDATHVLWLDTDMIFPEWALCHALARDVDIVTASYPRRGTLAPPLSVAITGGSSEAGATFSPTVNGDDLITIEACGFGFFLHRMEVLRRMKPPYFSEPWNEKRGEHMGEGVYFCKRARAAGYTIQADPHISRHLGHIGAYVYTFADRVYPQEQIRAHCQNAPRP